MKGQKKRNSATLGYTLALVVGLCVFLGINKSSESGLYKRCSGIVWTTQYNITYESDRIFDDSIQSIFSSVDNSLSMYNKASLISRINRGDAVEADSMVTHLYKASLKVHEETGGAFDPTVSPLMRLWGFLENGGTVPDSTQIDSVLQFVGLRRTSLLNGKIEKEDKRTAFDFSAIAKGFACDEIGRMLKRNGVDNYLVEVGGEIALSGVNPSGVKWRISVDSPVWSRDVVIHENSVVVELDTGGVATSGNYRNYKEVEGKRIVHTMNPKTGYPEETNLLSATIVAEDCMSADAYATACMVMGLEKSRAFLEQRDDLGGFLVYSVGGDSLEVWSNRPFDEICADAK